MIDLSVKLSSCSVVQPDLNTSEILCSSIMYWRHCQPVVGQLMGLMNSHTLHEVSVVSRKAVCFGSSNLTFFMPCILI
jgi:hypothetical protein